MFESAAKLGAVQAARAATAPSTTSPAAALLEPFRRRNAAIDALFYDIDAIDITEIPPLGDRLACEGAILVVPPSGGPRLRAYATVEDFFASDDRATRALAVAGVGSSAIGAAALARNVADAIEAPVAAVISGYGLADLPTEALGGALWFGVLNGLRDLFEQWDRAAGTSAAAEDALSRWEDGALFRLSVDTRSVLTLVKAGRFDLLVGHSKGALVIAEALFELKRTERARSDALAAAAQLVTIGARIAMPAGYAVLDVIGAWDVIGALNSRADIPADVVVPRAMHHTNPHVPFALEVTPVLRAAFAAGGPWQRPQRLDPVPPPP
jgi:hypothetical protein